MAPIQPALSEYLDRVRSGNAPAMLTSRGHSLGYIPPPLDLSHLKNQPTPFGVNPPLPSKYDLRTLNRVTPVKDQGQCGSCWAFATYGSAESVLMPGESRSFSENNLKNHAHFDWTPCQGGNAEMSAAYLTRWSGPVNTADDPYHATDTDTSPADSPIQKHEQQIIFIPGRNGPMDNDRIKSAVMNWGGVAVGLNMDESNIYLNQTTWAYYFNDWTSSGTNHMVTVVGWDDNYAAAKFAQTPPGNGAFLVKNSWGASWGLAGYFWVSYYTLQFADGWSTVFGGEEPLTLFNQQYEYDPMGWVSGIGWTNSTSFQFANVFTATQPGYLDAVATYTASNNTRYLLQVFKGAAGSPTGGALVFSDSGTVPWAGYNTFTVNPVHLVAGDVFSVVMTLNTPGYPFPAPIQQAITGYSSKASAAPGQSYYYDGANWNDLYDWSNTANFALKAFTSADSNPPTATPTFNPAPGTYTVPQTVSISAPAGAKVYYTTDGSTPTVFSPVYTASIPVTKSTIIRAFAIVSGHSPSLLGKGAYTLNLLAAAAPTIKPAGGNYGASLWVTLAPVTATTTAYFTVDGSAPSATSFKYTGPIAVNGSETIKAIAVGGVYAPSSAVSATYNLIPTPQCMTGLATSITATTATVSAKVNDFGGYSQVWFLWGTSANVLNNNTAKLALPPSAGSQQVSVKLTTLTTKTTYYFQPVVSSVGGVAYGVVQSFKTN